MPNAKKISIYIKNILHRIKSRFISRYSLSKYLALKFFNKSILKRNVKPVPGKKLADGKNICKNWIFHDENWIRVVDRKIHRKIVSAGLPLCIEDNFQKPAGEIRFDENGGLYFDNTATTNDEWIYLFLDTKQFNLQNFSWQFAICRLTYFREFQFGFRYTDFYNRYRFRFENNKVAFDKVWKGNFFNNISSVYFFMELGVFYEIRIDAYINNFKLYINGNLILDEYDFENIFYNGSVAVILWEDNGITNIKGMVGPMDLFDLKI